MKQTNAQIRKQIAILKKDVLNLEQRLLEKRWEATEIENNIRLLIEQIVQLEDRVKSNEYWAKLAFVRNKKRNK